MTHTDLEPMLSASRATPAFRSDLAAYAMRQPSPRVQATPMSPRVKVLRVMAQLLQAEPTLTIDRVDVRAVSGCADFAGTVTVTDADGMATEFAFEWNCEWKAQQLGYVDHFGFPDQIRAAQEFGWQCFKSWAPAGVRTSQLA
jgi:hypothetical protein